MKKITSFLAIGAITLATADAVAAPTSSAPVPPELRSTKVISIYSDAFTAATGWDFGEWGSGSTYSEITIGTDHIAQFGIGNNYFGWQFNNDVNAVAMDKLHVDLYAEEAGTINVYPICRSQAQGEKFQSVDITAGEWTSIDFDLQNFTDNGLDLSGVFQFKFTNTAGISTLWIDNVYFWDSSTSVDEEKPEGLTASLVSTSFVSATIQCQATDNSGAVIYRIKDEAHGINYSGGGASGVATNITVSGLTQGTTYNFVVTAEDNEGNVCDTNVPLEVTTDAYPASAPTPTQDAANVMSLYSDAYTAATGFNIGGWGQTTATTPVTLATGDNALLLEKFNYLGWEFHNTIDISEMTKLHIDFYSNNATELQVTPIWGGEKLISCTPVKQGEWNSFDIDLSEYDGMNAANIYQIKFVAKPEGSVIGFIDNVYFYKEIVEDDTNAPTWVVEPVAQNIKASTAEISATASDDKSSKVTYEASMSEDFATITANTTATSGEAAILTIKNLNASTNYTVYVRAKDASGNISEVKTATFTTAEAGAEPIWYGRIKAEDYVVGLNDWTPEIYYDITYLNDGHLLVNCTVAEFNDNNMQINFRDAGKFEVMTMVDGNNCKYTITSADTYEEGETLNNAFFYLAYPGKASRGNFQYTVGSSNEPSATVDKTIGTSAKVAGGNNTIIVSGSEGGEVIVNNISGSCTYRGYGDAVINAATGIYIVRIGNVVKKVIVK